MYINLPVSRPRNDNPYAVSSLERRHRLDGSFHKHRLPDGMHQIGEDKGPSKPFGAHPRDQEVSTAEKNTAPKEIEEKAVPHSPLTHDGLPDDVVESHKYH